jgi:hypothetical protein
MYTIMGRQVGSHVVRCPPTEKFACTDAEVSQQAGMILQQSHQTPQLGSEQNPNYG